MYYLGTQFDFISMHYISITYLERNMIVLGIYTANLRHAIRVVRLKKMDANAIIEQPIQNQNTVN